ncbi:Hypothetical protein mma_2926 [Janthinobacterium sp. Marseille]|nr:Hypothetical protein mma_2926 [Janthinobacterium sp. Marseille]
MLFNCKLFFKIMLQAHHPHRQTRAEPVEMHKLSGIRWHGWLHGTIRPATAQPGHIWLYLRASTHLISRT